MSTPDASDAAERGGWIVWCLPLVLWAGVFVGASHAWRTGEFYDYGWFVPPVVLAMAWRCLKEDPLAGRGSPGAVAWVVLVLAALAWWVLRVLLHVDPSWRLPQWTMAAMAAGATHVVAGWWAGPRASWRLLPVTAFALSAVPLPTVAEQLLIERLTHVVVTTAALVCNLLGDPVRVVGDRMESMGRWVEVSDGCSGIRSMQGFLMVALFFGEWFRLGRFERVLLLPLSLGCVLLLNIARAVALAWLGFRHGEAAVDRWHGGSGLLAFGLAAALVWWLAQALDTRRPPRAIDRVMPSVEAPGRVRRLAAAGVAALVLAEGAAWAWMHPATPTAAERVLVLEYPPPGRRAHFDPDAFHRVRPALGCGNGWIAAAETGAADPQVRIGWFEWGPQDATSVLEALKHSPDQCMGGVGWKLADHGEPRRVALPGGALGFDVTTFADHAAGTTVQVFKSVWISGDVAAGLRDGIAGFGSALEVRKLRLAAAWNRFRPAHARVLVAVVAGAAGPEVAWRRLQDELLAGLRFEIRDPAAAIARNAVRPDLDPKRP